MTSRERVVAVLQREKPDRWPLYGWLFLNLEKQINEAFGSLLNFEEKYEFDLHFILNRGKMNPFGYDLEKFKADHPEIQPYLLLENQLWNSPDNEELYSVIKEQVNFYKHEKGRFIYVQTPGIFEALNQVFGIEQHLMYLALYPEDLLEIYKLQAEWNRRFALNCLALGVDMIHVSDDWGSQNSLMFNPSIWRELIYPNHKTTCDAVKKAGGFLSLHSDGNITSILDYIPELGYDAIHPYQESAGMNYNLYMDKYSDKFALMTGMDVQTTFGFGKNDLLKKEISRIGNILRGAPIIFNTTHFIQEHCSMEELAYGFDCAYQCLLEYSSEV